jgi:hypothetical protein
MNISFHKARFGHPLVIQASLAQFPAGLGTAKRSGETD